MYVCVSMYFLICERLWTQLLFLTLRSLFALTVRETNGMLRFAAAEWATIST